MVFDFVTNWHDDSKQAENSIFIFFVGDSTCGQRALYQLGLTGIPIYNVSKVLNKCKPKKNLKKLRKLPFSLNSSVNCINNKV